MRSQVLLATLFLAFAALLQADHFADEVKGLPSCREKVPSAPASWERKKMGETFSFSLPACFQEVQTKEHQYIHGGVRWQCGGATVEVVWGMWGRSSFDSGGTQCAAKIAGKRVMVEHSSNSAGPSVVVWYPTGMVHEPLLSAWSTRPEDAALVSRIAFSGRIAPK